MFWSVSSLSQIEKGDNLGLYFPLISFYSFWRNSFNLLKINLNINVLSLVFKEKCILDRIQRVPILHHVTFLNFIFNLTKKWYHMNYFFLWNVIFSILKNFWDIINLNFKYVVGNIYKKLCVYNLCIFCNPGKLISHAHDTADSIVWKRGKITKHVNTVIIIIIVI